MFFTLLEAEGGFPTWLVGLITLLILLGALAFVRGVGKGRPHSS